MQGCLGLGIQLEDSWFLAGIYGSIAMSRGHTGICKGLKVSWYNSCHKSKCCFSLHASFKLGARRINALNPES